MIKRICFWINNSRPFSLPMTIMSWLAVFILGIKAGGDILNGILALIGISFAHLATNLFDDYIDYKILCKTPEKLEKTVKSKCAYIRDGSASLKELSAVVAVYCGIAALTGLILTFRAGLPVVWLALIGGVFVLSYARFSLVGLSEFAVGVTFGPLFFEGVWYVMTKTFSFNIFILSLSVVMFTIGLLYTHTLLDFDGDLCSHKKTLCCRIGDKNKALKVLAVILGLGYLFTGFYAFKTGNYFIFAAYLTIPLAIALYKSIGRYNNDPKALEQVNFWHYPLDNWAQIQCEGTESFYLRLFMARNLMMYYSLILCIALFI